MIIETNERYHAGPGISKSQLDAFAVSPFNYWAKYINPARPAQEPPTDDMFVGTVTHTLILEPEAFDSRYVLLPDDAPDRPTSAMMNAAKPSPSSIARQAWWSDFTASLNGREVVTREQWETAMSMRDAVCGNPSIKPLLSGGVAERSFRVTDPETGLMVKCRPDLLAGLCLDLKTTTDASPEAFARSAATWRYDIQDYWYGKVLQLATGERPGPMRFIVVEKKYPFSVGCYKFGEESQRRAKEAAERNYRQLVEHLEVGYYPDYSTEGEVEIDIPTWAKR